MRLALEAGHMGTWEWNLQTHQVHRSPGLESIFGRAPGTFLNTLIAYQESVHPEDRERVLQAIQDTVDEGREHHVEFRVVRPDGSVHWIEQRGKRFDDGQGQPSRMIAVCIDIDRRKRLEQELRERVDELAHAERRNRSVVDHVLDAIVTIDERAIIQAFNPAAEKLFGYPAAEVIGENVGVLMPEPHRSEHDRYVANYLRTGKAKIIGIGREVVGRRKDGSIFPMHLGVSEFRLGDRRYFTGIVRDITEQKRAERVARFLADASRSLAAIVDCRSTMQKIARMAVPFFADWCLVHVAHDEGTLQQVAAAHFDPAKAELAQAMGEKYRPGRDAPRGPAWVFRTGMSEIVENVSDASLEKMARDEEHLRILRELGLRSLISVPLTIRDKTLGTITFARVPSERPYDATDLAVAEDLGHRAAIAIENARLYDALRDADRRKDEFLAMLAHELRNPLAPLRSGLDLLALSGVEPDSVAWMQQQVEHLVRLVDDLLDVSRIMRCRVELRREIVDLGAVLRQAVDAARPAIEARRHALTISMPPDPIYLDADPVRLAQVFTNLLTNAAKYTEPGGTISLAARHENDQAAVAVRDTGVGISKRLLPHIFDLFTQAERTLERSLGGLGIGLTIVRNLVEMHGGSVTVQSEGEGKGSEFTVRIPAVSHAGHERVEEPIRAPGESRRILIVEDNVGTAKILARLLAKLGDHRIALAHDGVSACELARSHRPEIVLLDIGLPLLNGYDVARRLRQQPEFRETLLVALTGYGAEEDRRRSRDAGFDTHLVKPASLDALREVLAHPKLTGRSPVT